jgi:hypothetical protein
MAGRAGATERRIEGEREGAFRRNLRAPPDDCYEMHPRLLVLEHERVVDVEQQSAGQAGTVEITG